MPGCSTPGLSADQRRLSKIIHDLLFDLRSAGGAFEDMK